MDISTTKDSFNHVVKKRKFSLSKSLELVDQVSIEIESALEQILSVDNLIPPEDQKAILMQLKHRLDTVSPVTLIEGPQKEVIVSLCKYPRLLEKSFNPDISKAYRSVEFDFNIINQVIATHFYQKGLFDLGDCLLSEAGVEATSLKSQFVELQKMCDAIRVRNVEPALTWVSNNLEKLRQIGSKLELKLHSSQFMEILKGGTRADTLCALNYAKTHLSPLAGVYLKEFQKITVCVLWSGKLERYPYSEFEFLSPTYWEDLADEFSRDYYKLVGHCYRDPLAAAIAAGIEGLPTLLKLANVMSAKNREWQELKQLPVPVELSKDFQFHSIFVCPVSREQSSDENPPMMMPCLHVLCKKSIMKLSKSSSRPFKCPYCPAEATVALCRQLVL
ncbi:Protein RMD5 homolog [Linum grandiflorum]